MLILQSRMHSWGCDEILSGWKVPLGHSPWIAPPPCLALPMTMWGSHQYALTKQGVCIHDDDDGDCYESGFHPGKGISDPFAHLTHIMPIERNLEYQNRAKIFLEVKWCYSKWLYNSRVMQEGEEDGGGTEGKWLVLPAKVKTFLHTGENLKSNG